MKPFAEITPRLIYSTLQQNWTATIPSTLVASGICLPAVIFHWPYQWAFIVTAIVAYFVVDFGMAKLRSRWRTQAATTPPKVFPQPPECDWEQRAACWKELFKNSDVTSFVLFSYGTCVVFVDDAEGDDAEEVNGTTKSDDAESRVEQAKDLLQQFGHSIPGTSSADSFIYELEEGELEETGSSEKTNDIVIGGHHSGIFTFIPHETFASAPQELHDPFAAALGREFRTLDTFTTTLIAVHTC